MSQSSVICVLAAPELAQLVLAMAQAPQQCRAIAELLPRGVVRRATLHHDDGIVDKNSSFSPIILCFSKTCEICPSASFRLALLTQQHRRICPLCVPRSLLHFVPC